MNKPIKKLLNTIFNGKKTGHVGFKKYDDATLPDIMYAAGFTPLYAYGDYDIPIGMAPDYADVDDDGNVTYYPDVNAATYLNKYDRHVLTLAMGRR